MLSTRLVTTVGPCLLLLLGFTACGPGGREDNGTDVSDDDDSNAACTEGELVCVAGNVYSCAADGFPGDLEEMCVEGCNGGVCQGANDNCSAESQLVYVVDDANRLLSFDPRKLMNSEQPFTLLGNLNCNAGTSIDGSGLPATPFSMSVDRDAVAWILYSSGKIFNVPVTSLACSDSGYTARQQGMDLFGMGFVTDEAGGEAEKLFVAGGQADATPGGRLGDIDPATKALSLHGTLRSDTEYSPELTGTGDAKLYAFYPGLDETFVQEVNQTTGAGTGPEYPYPGGFGNGGLLESIRAWAFAQWGGVFYLFTTVSDDFEGTTNSTVRTIDPVTGATATVMQNLPYIIVGAGVSTCAPVVID